MICSLCEISSQLLIDYQMDNYDLSLDYFIFYSLLLIFIVKDDPNLVSQFGLQSNFESTTQKDTKSLPRWTVDIAPMCVLMDSLDLLSHSFMLELIVGLSCTNVLQNIHFDDLSPSSSGFECWDPLHRWYFWIQRSWITIPIPLHHAYAMTLTCECHMSTSYSSIQLPCATFSFVHVIATCHNFICKCHVQALSVVMCHFLIFWCHLS